LHLASYFGKCEATASDMRERKIEPIGIIEVPVLSLAVVVTENLLIQIAKQMEWSTGTATNESLIYLNFPATIADLYDRDNMPADLRAAHERNDEVLERIYIGRRFKNDTERLEKLFDLYTKMTAGQKTGKKRKVEADA